MSFDHNPNRFRIKRGCRLVTLVVQDKHGQRAPWVEFIEAPSDNFYDAGGGGRPLLHGDDADRYGRELIKWFNRTSTRPGDTGHRVLVAAWMSTADERAAFEARDHKSVAAAALAKAAERSA